ncbi:MAG: fasciclin domain-containing protein [bacterium]
MKFISKFSKIIPILLFAFVLVACSDDDDNNVGGNDPLPNIVELAQSNADLSSLVAALQAADGDLVNVLSGGTFTVLAPTNAAFDAFLSANGFSSLDQVPTDVLANILLNHVITGEVASTDLVASGAGYASTNATGFGGNNMSLYFDTSAGVRFNNVASVITPDVEASNGIVHVIDGVIGLPSIVDHALANSGFSSLVAALGAADGDLVNVLSGAGPFTVLAPDNNAFTTFLDGTALADVPTDALAQILLNHVLAGGTLSTDLVSAGAGYTNTSATGAGMNPMSLYFNTSEGVRFNGISSVAQADVIGTNGVIHAVDAVIGLPTVVDFALADPTFETLVAALTRDDLTTDFVSVLSTADGTAPAPFTVFAPTNDAFGDLLTELMVSGLGDIDEPTLNATLTYHVIGGANVQASGLSDNLTISTLGGDITANVNPSPTITDANDRVSNIIAFDVQAANGVIHAIDKVILPPLE